jgi:hypothetical protein
MVSRWYRVGVLTLLTLGAWLIASSSVGAAAVGAAIDSGPLTISPAIVNLTYTIPTGGRKNIVKSSFAVTITDATGTAAGWEVRAAAVATLGPLGATPDVDHAIIDFDITEANGVPPNPTCICNTIPAVLGEILRTPPQTGIGRSTEKFITQLTVPAGATPGTYRATVALDVVSLGPVLPLPGGRPTGPTIGGPAPSPLPQTPRPVPTGATNPGAVTPGTPNSLPGSRPSVAAPASAANGTASRPVSNTNVTTDGTQTSAALPAAPATSSDTPPSTAAPASGSRTMDQAADPRTTGGTQPSGADTASTTSGISNGTAPVQSVTAQGGAPSTNGAPPTTDRAVMSTATEPVAPGASAYPVAMLVGNAISFAPAPTVDSDKGAAGASVNWHLQATYASAGRSAISRVFGHSAPTRMNAGAVAIVVTESGPGQATMTFAPPQAGAHPAVIEPAVLTISIATGP